jgi:hypothetical protein
MRQHAMFEYFEYLNDLRESGETNMFGATPYLMMEFDMLSKEEARAILSEWMKSFEDKESNNDW